MDITERKEDIYSVHHLNFKEKCLEMEITAKSICWDIMRLHGETSMPQRRIRFPIHTGMLSNKWYDRPDYIMSPNADTRKNDLKDKIFYHTRDMEFGLYSFEYMTIKDGPFHKKPPCFIIGVDYNYDIEWFVPVQVTITNIVYEWREPFPYVRILTGEDIYCHNETHKKS